VRHRRKLMKNIKKIVVDGVIVVEKEMRVWDQSDFVLRFGKEQDVQFHVKKIYEEEGEAHCDVVSGGEVLLKIAAA